MVVVGYASNVLLVPWIMPIITGGQITRQQAVATLYEISAEGQQAKRQHFAEMRARGKEAQLRTQLQRLKMRLQAAKEAERMAL